MTLLEKRTIPVPALEPAEFAVTSYSLTLIVVIRDHHG